MVQNNFTNAHLHSIGKQLSIIEGQSHPSIEPSGTIEKRLKNPMFKPYQISNNAQQEIRTNKYDFLDTVNEQLSQLGQTSFSNTIVSDTS